MAQFIDFGNGREGAISIGDTTFATVGGFGLANFTGTAGNNYGTFSDRAYFNGSNGGRIGDLCIIHQTQGTDVGNWEIVRITSRNGTTIYFDRPLANSYTTGCQIQSSPNLFNATLGGTLTPLASWNGTYGGIVFIVDKGTFTINGAINTNGYGFRGGASVGSNNTKRTGNCGDGTVGNSIVQGSPNGNGGSGGNDGGDASSGGGGGGNAEQGQLGGSAEGGTLPYGGYAVGNAGLTNMCLGGGGGSTGTGPRTYPSSAGASGGGIVVIIAKNFVLSNSIGLSGNNGVDSGGEYHNFSGAGAGGSCLIKCQTASIGTNRIIANGGTGGMGRFTYGGNGSTGRIHIDYLISYSGSTTPTINATQDTSLKSFIYSGMI